MADDAMALLAEQVVKDFRAQNFGPVTALRARQIRALDAQQRHAYDAAYDAQESVSHPEDIDFYIEMVRRDTHGWPISGDDLTLARAGKKA